MRLVEFLENKRATSKDFSVSTERILESVSFSSTTLPDDEIPIVAKEADWVTLSDPERLFREYGFKKLDVSFTKF